LGLGTALAVTLRGVLVRGEEWFVCVFSSQSTKPYGDKAERGTSIVRKPTLQSRKEVKRKEAESRETQLRMKVDLFRQLLKP
jgi:hypothetical protein